MASVGGVAAGVDLLELRRRLDATEQRLRSLLSVVGTVARRSAGNLSEPNPNAWHFDGRMNAIARAQCSVTARPHGAVGLHALIADELLAHAAAEGRQFRLNGPDVDVSGRAVVIVWLVVHELVVNAVKFGALSARHGWISVDWALTGGPLPAIELCWIERGGPSATDERVAGFGTDMIERKLARELGGSGALEFLPNGLTCRLRLPVSDEIRLLQPA